MSRSESSTRGVGLLYGGFFLFGIVGVFLGPLIPELQAAWEIEESRIASLFLAQFLSSALGAVLSSFRRRLSVIGGYAMMAAGLAGMAGMARLGGGLSMAWVAMGFIGFGIGLVATATNLTVAHLNPHRRGASLATLNLIWGLGAVTCQLLFAAIRGRVDALDALWPLVVALALLPPLIAWRLGEEPEVEAPAGSASQDEGVSLGFCLLIAGMMFFYVGSETAIGGWLVSLSDQLANERSAGSLLVNACFWGALLAGRASAPALLSRRSEPALFKISLAVALAGSLVILAAPSRGFLALGAALAGFGLAPMFPLTASMLAARTAASGSRGTGWIFAFTGLGGACVPWLAGQVAEPFGLRSGFLVPLAALILLAVLFASARRHGGSTARRQVDQSGAGG